MNFLSLARPYCLKRLWAEVETDVTVLESVFQGRIAMLVFSFPYSRGNH